MFQSLVKRFQSLFDLWAYHLAALMAREPQRTSLYWRNGRYQFEDGTDANLQHQNIDGTNFQCEIDTDLIAFSQLDVPVGAENHLAGIVASKLPQISPWELSNLLYGYTFDAAAQPSEQGSESGGTLTIAMANAGQLSFGPDKAPLKFEPGQMRYQTLNQSGEPIVLARPGATSSGNNATLTGRIKLALSATAFAGVVAWVGGLGFDYWQATQLQSLDARQVIARNLLANQQSAADAKDNPIAALAIFKDARPSRLATLETLAIILGDSVYIDSLQIDADTVRFTARAQDAGATLRDVADSDVFEQEAFSGPITRQKDTNQLRFEISARISDTAAAGLEIEKLLAVREAQQ